MEKVAESKKIEEVLEFVNERRNFLMEYTGNQIAEGMKTMAQSAQAIQRSIGDIKKLA